MEKEINVGDLLVLEPHQVRSNVTRALLNNYSESQRTVHIETVRNETRTQLIVGKLVDISWSIPGIIPELADITLTVRINSDDEAPRLQLETLSGQFRHEDESLPIIGRVVKTGEVHIQIDPTSTLIPHSKKLNTFIPSMTNLNDQFVSPSTSAIFTEILIGYERESITVLQSASFQLNQVQIPLFKDLISDESYFTQTQFLAKPTEHFISSWQVHGAFSMKHSPTFEMNPISGGGIRTFVKFDESHSIDTHDIAEFFNLPELASTLSSSFENLPFFHHSLIAELKLESLDFTIGPNRSSLIESTISGNTKLDEYRFNFEFSLPRYALQCSLDNETPIPVNRILTSFFPDGIGLSEDLTISQFELSVGSRPVSVQLGLSLSSVWKFELGKTPFELQRVRIHVLKQQGSTVRGIIQADITIGSVDIQIEAKNDGDGSNAGWLFETVIAHEVGIPLSEIVSTFTTWFHFDVPDNLPSILIKDIHLSFHTKTHEFSISGTAELTEQFGALQKGDIALTLHLKKEPGKENHSFELLLNGSLNVSDTQLDFDAQIVHENWGFTIHWEKETGAGIQFLKLIETIDSKLDVSSIDPKTMNALTFSGVSLSYQHSNHTFLISFTTDGGEKAVFTSQSIDGKLDLLLGIGYKKVEDFPTELGEHLQKLEHIELEELWFIAGKINSASSLPELPNEFPFDFTPPSSGIFLKAMAVLDLTNDNGHPELNLIKEHLPSRELILSAQISKQAEEIGITLRAELDGTIEIPLEKSESDEKENTLALEDGFIEFDYHGSNFQLSLGGTMHFVIDHLPLSPTIRLVVSSERLSALVDLKFGDDIHEGWHPFGITGLTVDRIGLLLGIDFETMGLEMGLQGNMSLKENNKNTDKSTENKIEFGIVLEMIGDVPNPEFFALSIQKIDFSKLAQLFVGSSEEGNNAVSTTLTGENLSIYWAEKVLTLPDGTRTNPLFGLHGEFDIFGWKAYAHLDVHTDSGISGDVQTDKIEWGIFELTGDGKELRILVDENNQPISNATLSSNSPKVQENARSKVIVHEGGPVIHFNSTTSPFLHASIHATLLKFIHADLDANVTDKGFNFDVHFEIEHLADFRLACSLENGTSFDATGNFFVGIDLPIETVFGHTEFELGAYANMHVHIDGANPHDFALSLNGGLDVMGLEIPFVSVNIKDFPTKAEAIPLWLAAQFTNDLFPPLHHLFEQAYKEIEKGPEPYDAKKQALAEALLDHAEYWANFVDADLEELNNQQHISAMKAESLIKTIDKQTAKINACLNSLKTDNEANHTAESERLQLHANEVVENAKQIRERSATNRSIIIANQDREIRELQDVDRQIRSTIDAIWDEFLTQTIGKTPTEIHNMLGSLEIEIQQRIDELKLPIPVEYIETHQNNEQTHRRNAHDADYNHHLNVEAKYTLYATTQGKFTPRAVDHHATIIGNKHRSERMIAAILWEAQEQAKTIVERTQQEMDTFSNSL